VGEQERRISIVIYGKATTTEEGDEVLAPGTPSERVTLADMASGGTL